MNKNIICPNCWTKIDLDSLAESVYKEKLRLQEEKLRKEQQKQRKIFEKELEQKTIEMRKKAQEFAEKKAQEERKKVELEIKYMQEQLKKAEEEKQQAKKRELEFLIKQKELEEKQKNFELELEKKLFKEKKKLEEKILDDLKEKQKRDLDEKMAKIQEDFRKKELEYQKQQEQLKKALDDAKRKAEQQSQQIQWDIQEEDLKNSLIQAFPIDEVLDVPTWIKWADLIQKVKNSLGQLVWIIVWESKNTKAWSDSWIMKLKNDKLKVNWNIAILVSRSLPKNIKNFWMIDDVMVCAPEFIVPVCSILRDKLISINKVEKSLEWKDVKMELLYKYLSSEEFSSKINMMVDVFANLKAEIDAERRTMERHWKKREKDLERATFAITWMYWELESLMWQSLPWSERFELPSWED